MRARVREFFSRKRSSAPITETGDLIAQPATATTYSADDMEHQVDDESGLDGELEGRRHVLNFASALVAAEQCQIRCPIHEWCNATCADPQPALEYRPLLSPGPVFSIQPPPSVSFPETADSSPLVNTAALEPYTYDPLPPQPGFIRLVRIQPAVFVDDPVTIELIQVRHSEELKYAALSYVWGPAVFDHDIACNGKRLSITKTLHDALKRHRQHQHTEPCDLWTDAICINQADMAELNSQIHFMNFIYMFASVVYLDFGNAEPSWFSGLDVLTKLKTFAEVDWQDCDLEDLPLHGMPPQGDEAWTNYLSIWTLPWFRRTWIVQEFVLARETVCRFGRFTFKWDDLATSFRSLNRLHIQSLLAATVFDGPTARNWSIGVLNHQRLYDLRDRFSRCTLQSPDRIEPIGLLWTMREFDVSNPKDRIIATMGMLPPPSEASFHFDYAWSFDKLYHRFAVWLVWGARPLWGSYERNRMLSHAGLERRVAGSRENESLPSWAPDWRAQSIEQYAKPLYSIRKVPYRAISRSRGSAMFPIPEDGTTEIHEARQILVSGRLLDTIVGIADGPAAAHKSEKDALEEWHVNAFNLCETTAATSQGALTGTYPDWEDAFARTLLGNDLYSGTHAMPSYAPIASPTTTRREALTELRSNPRWMEASVGYAQRSAPATYLQQMTTVCRNRKFAVGEKGYMTLVPELAAVGDEVFLISGCAVPFLLRRRDAVEGGAGTGAEGGIHVLVGECYVHGVMEGEEISGNEADWKAVRLG